MESLIAGSSDSGPKSRLFSNGKDEDEGTSERENDRVRAALALVSAAPFHRRHMLMGPCRSIRLSIHDFKAIFLSFDGPGLDFASPFHGQTNTCLQYYSGGFAAVGTLLTQCLWCGHVSLHPFFVLRLEGSLFTACLASNGGRRHKTEGRSGSRGNRLHGWPFLLTVGLRSSFVLAEPYQYHASADGCAIWVTNGVKRACIARAMAWVWMWVGPLPSYSLCADCVIYVHLPLMRQGQARMQDEPCQIFMS